jgi:uncharacterized protein (DUF305 family)
MDKTFLYAVLGSLVGIIVGILLMRSAVNTNNYPMMKMMGMRILQEEEIGCRMQEEKDENGMDMSMNQMSSRLATLEGDEFDKEFLIRMTDHHQGAIDMAELVLKKSERPELRDLAEDIITTQTKEIEIMEGWMRNWFGGGE